MCIRGVRSVRFSDVFRGIKKDYWEEKGLKKLPILLLFKNRSIKTLPFSWKVDGRHDNVALEAYSSLYQISMVKHFYKNS